METKFESRIGKIASSDEKIFTFLSNFNNFRNFLPPDKAADFESTEEQCKFNVPPVGKLTLKVVEKEPFSTIKIMGEGMGNQQFFMWVQLKMVEPGDTRVKLTFKADVNPMIKMMISKPIQDFLDKLVDAMEKIPG
jgi:carbon monoxide dehydrogenase subunit G